MSTRRGRKLATQSEKLGQFKRFRRGNLTANPKAFFRDPNLSAFGAGHGRGFMAPYGGGFFASMGNMVTGAGRAETPNFSGGMFARMGAVNRLERKAARGVSTARGDLNLARVAKMNASAGSLVTTTPTRIASGASYSQSLGMNLLERGGLNATAYTAQDAFSTVAYERSALGNLIEKGATGQALTVGERRYMTAAGVRGKYTRSMMEKIFTSGGGSEMRTMMGTSGYKTFATNVNNLMPGNTGGAYSGVRYIQMTDTAEKIIRPLAGALDKDVALRTLASSRGLAARHGTASLATEIVDKGIIKSLGTRGAMQVARAGGARVGLAVAGEAAMAAIPGVNLIFAADMAYQLAKLGGLAVKGAINFGKDAMKSMQGNISGGLFGSYKDDEVRATSRARGVMAIQNSRLNARSLLGSEGAMMAAHYG